MRVIMTGAGSIGSRHMKNLSKVCAEKSVPLEIDVIRYSDRVLPDDIAGLVHREIRDKAALGGGYDAAFITEATSTHFESIKTLRGSCKHMFIEKPVFDHVSYPIEEIEPPEGSVYYVACPIRFSNYYREIAGVVRDHKVYAARIIFSSYMPHWQKGRDYRESFRCSVERGGGVDIDSIHEIDYMTSIFGFPRSVHRAAGQYSDLEMEACDIAAFLFTYDDKLIETHLDYFGRANQRRIELFTKEDVIVIDYHKRTVENRLSGTVRTYEVDDQFYEKEMRYFVDLMLSNGEIGNMNPVDRAFKNLKIAKGISLRDAAV